VAEQEPVLPQVAAASVGHSLSGSVPAGSASQNPARPTWLHFSHVPPQRASQQTPSVQKPLAQAASTVHAAPVAVRQRPPAQPKPGAQSAFAVHALRQAPALQVYGLHARCPESTQRPFPSQRSAGAALVAERHEAAAQIVVAG
jgi:hypothetical protein